MKTILVLMIGVIMVTMESSCKKDFLDTKPLNQIPAEDAWKDGPLAEAFVTEIYNGLGWGGFNEQMLASLTDETMFTHAGRGINTINEGTLNPSNLGWIGSTNSSGNQNWAWPYMFPRIRSTNVALANLQTATFNDTALNNRLKGEAHFLRGYFYHQLVRFYGGVPIITKVYQLNEDYSIPRNSFEECVNFIVKECDSAIMLIGNKTMPKGRATKLAAMALQSRILLYAASDLHDIPMAKAKSPDGIGSYANPEILGYLSGSRTERWQRAKDAAKAVLDAGGGGYKLNLSAPVTVAEGKNNYLSIAMAGKSKAPGVDASAEIEVLYARYFVPNQPEGAQQQGLYNGPNGYNNWAGNTPIQQLVDDYEMMDGTRFDWNKPDEKATPYDNRDPRFYVSILYDGAPWKPRDKINPGIDPVSQIQTGKYQVGNVIIPGLDTRQSPIQNWNGSWSGYYMRKFVDPDPAIVDNNGRQFVPWAFFRYTEAVFNYAEACIELGQDAEAQTWLNKIRYRAGMPAITETGAALRERFRNEKRIEMVFEEQRYHDARRWMIAKETLGRKIRFINVLGTLKPGATAPTPYRFDRTLFDYTYTPVEDNSLENRQWLDKMYFLPISRDEMNKNQKLVQNPGY